MADIVELLRDKDIELSMIGREQIADEIETLRQKVQELETTQIADCLGGLKRAWARIGELESSINDALAAFSLGEAENILNDALKAQ